MLATVHILIHLISSMNNDRCCYHSHFTDGKTEALGLNNLAKTIELENE